VGEQVNVTGAMETGPEGDTHLEVQTLTGLNDEGAPTAPESRDSAKSRDQRLRDLQAQLDRIQQEIEQLRRER
jgi:hypothetical protein